MSRKSTRKITQKTIPDMIMTGPRRKADEAFASPSSTRRQKKKTKSDTEISEDAAGKSPAIDLTSSSEWPAQLSLVKDSGK